MQVLYFAWLRERIGSAEEQVDLPASVQTVGDLITWLRAQDARHATALAEPGSIRCAVNHDIAGHDTPIKPSDEVAFFPPVTGG